MPARSRRNAAKAPCAIMRVIADALAEAVDQVAVGVDARRSVGEIGVPLVVRCARGRCTGRSARTSGSGSHRRRRRSPDAAVPGNRTAKRRRGPSSSDLRRSRRRRHSRSGSGRGSAGFCATAACRRFSSRSTSSAEVSQLEQIHGFQLLGGRPRIPSSRNRRASRHGVRTRRSISRRMRSGISGDTCASGAPSR